MSRRSPVGKPFAVGGTVALAVVPLLAGIALAMAPQRGWTYTTAPAAKVFVFFKVSADGKRVTNVGAGIAVKCRGGAGGFPSARPGSGKITKHGTFKVTLKLYPPGRSRQKSSGTDTITGKFVAGGKANGTVRTYFNGQNAASFCRGITRSYTAIGKA